MFDVLIVGHSLSDPDIAYILELAKSQGDPRHPVYFVSSGYTRAEELELLEKYNIELIQYSNNDGKHSELVKMMRAMNRFIVPRSQRERDLLVEAHPTEESEIAMAISIHRRLQDVQPGEYLSPIVLLGLSTVGPQGVRIESVPALPILQNLSSIWAQRSDELDSTLEQLLQDGLVRENSGEVALTCRGLERVADYQTSRSTEIAQAYGQFKLSLKGAYQEITSAQIEDCKRYAQEVIVASFAARGLVIANKVFSGRSARPRELSDIFGNVAEKAAHIEDPRLRTAFIEAMHEFIVEPSPPQKVYLASVSQGYFLFHLLGLDARLAAFRRDIFRRTLWLCDSSVLLPLPAVGCHNHEYATALFESLLYEKAILCTTPKLLREVSDHLDWAIRFSEENRSDSIPFIRAALVQGNFKQNLFLDGYIRLSATGDVGTFSDYIDTTFSSSTGSQGTLEQRVKDSGVQLIRIGDLPGFEDKDWGDIESAKAEIQLARYQGGTYRSPLQVETEAEILVLLRNLRSGKYSVSELEIAERFYFVSQSQILERVSDLDTTTTWSPESVYRYLSEFSRKPPDPDMLQQCMLHEYFYAGISFIDKSRYEHFFGPSIDAAKASYETERAQYISGVESTYGRSLDDAFQQTPDLEKPLFVTQMAWQRARQLERSEDRALRRARDAEEKVRELEAERERAWKARDRRSTESEDARRRNLLDPKHLRKRRRQAKKRRRKK